MSSKKAAPEASYNSDDAQENVTETTNELPSRRRSCRQPQPAPTDALAAPALTPTPAPLPINDDEEDVKPVVDPEMTPERRSGSAKRARRSSLSTEDVTEPPQKRLKAKNTRKRKDEEEETTPAKKKRSNNGVADDKKGRTTGSLGLSSKSFINSEEFSQIQQLLDATSSITSMSSISNGLHHDSNFSTQTSHLKEMVWGRLISENGKGPTQSFTSNPCTMGLNESYEFTKLYAHPFWTFSTDKEGPKVKSLNDKGMLKVNNISLYTRSYVLRDGDEITIDSPRYHFSYIFQAVSSTFSLVDPTPDFTNVDGDMVESLVKPPGFVPTIAIAKTSAFEDPKTTTEDEIVTETDAMEDCDTHDITEKESPFVDNASPYVPPHPSLSPHIKMDSVHWQKRQSSLLKVTETNAASNMKLMTVSEIFFDELKKIVVEPEGYDGPTLEDFPYYLDADVKNALVHSLYISFEQPSFAPVVSDLQTVGRKVLLTGPPGSEIYQETLVKAVAHRFRSRFLVLGAETLLNNVIKRLIAEKVVQAPSALESRVKKLKSRPGKGGSEASKTLSQMLYPFVNSAADYRFKKGDRVKYFGPPVGHGASKLALGSKGKVVLAFDDDTKKIGVRFDRPVPNGVDLGGMCEDTFGLFVKPIELRPEDWTEPAEFLLLDNVRRLVCGESSITDLNCFDVLLGGHTPSRMQAEDSTLRERTPIILFVKDAEHSMFCSSDRFMCAKKFLEVIEQYHNVGIIGSAIQSNNQNKKEATVLPLFVQKTASLSSSSSSSSSSTNSQGSHSIFDMPFFDHLRGIEDKAKEQQRVLRVLSKLLPNKIAITPPIDYASLEKWKSDIERDVEHSKASTNQLAIDEALEKSKMTCKPIPERFICRTVFSSDEIEKIIGWAASFQLFQSPPPTPIPAPSSSSTSASSSPLSSSSSSSLQLSGSPESEADPLLNKSAEVQRSLRCSKRATRKKGPQHTTTEATVSPTGSQSSPLPPVTLEIQLPSMVKAIKMLESIESHEKPITGLQNIEPENEFEKRLMADVIAPKQLGVSFTDIGSLEKIKEVLHDVLLPLKRPELFRHSSLTKPCKGVLLFGPPGTGKTMLAKAVASESGANLLNIPISAITSKWFGEGEKITRAIFTLASKLAPCIIFIDEVDCILGKRDSSNEHEAMRKIKNEFMTMWDGLTTRDTERVLLLAATNRPFDLDDAVLRRFPRRILVDLPDEKCREQILRVILGKEPVDPDLDFAELARLTDGYNGSDLKSLCVSAAFVPIREYIALEKKKEREPEESDRDPKDLEDFDEDMGTQKTVEKKVEMRQLRLADFLTAKKEVGPSVSEDSFSVNELRRWNETYGSGGARQSSVLPYFT